MGGRQSRPLVLQLFNPAFTPKDAFAARTRCRRSFAAQQIKFCGAAMVLRRSKCFARGASEFIHNHGRHYEHCMSLPVVEEGETSECPSFMGS